MAGPNPLHTLALLEGDSPYLLLGVRESASPADIKRVFRELAMDLHPDRNMQHPDLPAIRARFDKIKLAYDVLSDRQLRQAYDAQALMARSSFRAAAAAGAAPVAQRAYGGGSAAPKSYTHFNPDTMYGDFSYYQYRPAATPASRFRNSWIAAAVVGFAAVGACVQYWRYQNGSALIRAALARENATNMEVMAGVRERAIGRSPEAFHEQLEQHIMANRAARMGRARRPMPAPAYARVAEGEGTAAEASASPAAS
ncbi:hypothetical protein H9P43_003247 [Blastocladiella emersonii ATCC 22665]|nr:hypothetical protein H9P43_003247 [Blastocladiella emersonii ATCC 22665]